MCTCAYVCDLVFVNVYVCVCMFVSVTVCFDLQYTEINYIFSFLLWKRNWELRLNVVLYSSRYCVVSIVAVIVVNCAFHCAISHISTMAEDTN